MRIRAILALCLLLFLRSYAPAEPAGLSQPIPGLRQEFEERLKKIDPTDTKALYDLSVWCGEKRLKKERQKVLEMILDVDPEHEKANRGLGRVRYEGKWLTPADRDALVAAKRAETMRALGLVKYKGSWITREEKASLEKGLVLHKGKWIKPDQVKQADGLVQVNGEWVKREDSAVLNRMQAFTACSGVKTSFHFTRHCCLFTEFGDSYNRSLAAKLEKGFAWFAEKYGVQLGPALFGGQKLVICAFDEREAFDRFVT